VLLEKQKDVVRNQFSAEKSVVFGYTVCCLWLSQQTYFYIGLVQRNT